MYIYVCVSMYGYLFGKLTRLFSYKLNKNITEMILKRKDHKDYVKRTNINTIIIIDKHYNYH